MSTKNTPSRAQILAALAAALKYRAFGRPIDPGAPGAVAQCLALLPIHPRHSQAILDGTKVVELRRRWLTKHKVTAVAMYETAPTKTIVGVFELRALHFDSGRNIWVKWQHCAGVEYKEFLKYFGVSYEWGSFMSPGPGYALEIGEVYRFVEPVPLGALGITSPPHSAQYLDDVQAEALWRRTP